MNKKWSSLVVIIVSFILLNILFNFKIWNQITQKENKAVLAIQGESFIYEYFAEVVRNNILTGQNPFNHTTGVFYPFGWDVATDDVAPVNGFYFLLLRPFFSLHQSMMIILVLSVFLSNITMYIFLRLLRISTKTAFLVSLIFGFSPFVSVRIGAHPNYTALYLFPLVSIFFLQVCRLKKRKELIASSTFLGLSLVILLFTNFYYSLMLFILAAFWFLYFFATDFKKSIAFIKKKIVYFFLTSVFSLVLCLPWLSKVLEALNFQQYSKIKDWNDVIYYSADFTSIFVPNRLNPFYAPFLKILAVRIPKLVNLFETFIYPGLIILITYLVLILLYRKFTKLLKKRFMPFFITSIFFWVLTFGPYLKIFDKKLPFIFPYALILKLPLLQMARAPGRFIVGFIFLASIVTAMILDYIFEKKTIYQRNIFFVFLMLIFLFDQSYTIALPPLIKINLPLKIYDYLSKNNKGPVLEVPFAIRDGHKNLGNFYAVWSAWPQLAHKQKIFGIFGGRIKESTFDYFSQNPLFGPLGKLIDRNATNEGKIVQNFDWSKMSDSIDFFGIEHVIIKKKEPYSVYALSTFTKLGFKQIKTDSGYDLLYKKPRVLFFDHFILGSTNDYLYLEGGWQTKEKNGRWVAGKIANVLLRVDRPKKYELKFKSKSLNSKQTITIYLNRKKLKDLMLTQKTRSYKLILDSDFFHSYFNIITFKFSNTEKPFNILKKTSDERDLAAFFSELEIFPQ